LIDPAAYAGALDAIDAILADPAKQPAGRVLELAPGGRLVQVGEDPRRWRPPADAAEPLAVAALQRFVWHEAERFSPRPRDDGEFNRVMSLADRLVKRKLRLAPRAAGDLAMFGLFPPMNVPHNVRGDYLAPVLKHLEAALVPPAPRPARKGLQYLRQRIVDLIDAERASYAKWGGKPGTKRYEQAIARVDALLGRKS
jgi:hypothetical protein